MIYPVVVLGFLLVFRDMVAGQEITTSSACYTRWLFTTCRHRLICGDDQHIGILAMQRGYKESISACQPHYTLDCNSVCCKQQLQDCLLPYEPQHQDDLLEACWMQESCLYEPQPSSQACVKDGDANFKDSSGYSVIRYTCLGESQLINFRARANIVATSVVATFQHSQTVATDLQTFTCGIETGDCGAYTLSVAMVLQLTNVGTEGCPSIGLSPTELMPCQEGRQWQTLTAVTPFKLYLQLPPTATTQNAQGWILLTSDGGTMFYMRCSGVANFPHMSSCQETTTSTATPQPETTRSSTTTSASTTTTTASATTAATTTAATTAASTTTVATTTSTRSSTSSTTTTASTTAAAASTAVETTTSTASGDHTHSSFGPTTSTRTAAIFRNSTVNNATAPMNTSTDPVTPLSNVESGSLAGSQAPDSMMMYYVAGGVTGAVFILALAALVIIVTVRRRSWEKYDPDVKPPPSDPEPKNSRRKPDKYTTVKKPRLKRQTDGTVKEGQDAPDTSNIEGLTASLNTEIPRQSNYYTIGDAKDEPEQKTRKTNYDSIRWPFRKTLLGKTSKKRTQKKTKKKSKEPQAEQSGEEDKPAPPPERPGDQIYAAIAEVPPEGAVYCHYTSVDEASVPVYIDLFAEDGGNEPSTTRSPEDKGEGTLTKKSAKVKDKGQGTLPKKQVVVPEEREGTLSKLRNTKGRAPEAQKKAVLDTEKMQTKAPAESVTQSSDQKKTTPMPRLPRGVKKGGHSTPISSGDEEHGHTALSGKPSKTDSGCSCDSAYSEVEDPVLAKLAAPDELYVAMEMPDAEVPPIPGFYANPSSLQAEQKTAGREGASGVYSNDLYVAPDTPEMTYQN